MAWQIDKSTVMQEAFKQGYVAVVESQRERGASSSFSADVTSGLVSLLDVDIKGVVGVSERICIE